MDLEDFTIAVLCLVEELLAELLADPDWPRVRTRGPAPTLADSEVLTMELVGEFLGYDQDIAIYRYFRTSPSTATSVVITPRGFRPWGGSIARPASVRRPAC